MHEIFNTLNTSIHTATSDYNRTEQNGEPHNNPSLVMASYSLQTTGSWLLWAVTVHHHGDPEKLKQKYPQHSYSMSFVLLDSYSHGSFSPLSCYPYINVVATHTTIWSPTLLLAVTWVTRYFPVMYISENFPPWNACVSLLVARLRIYCHVK